MHKIETVFVFMELDVADMIWKKHTEDVYSLVLIGSMKGN